LRFEELNLLVRGHSKGMFDVIFCRNVVIYFDAPTRMALWRRFAERLKPGGTLFVGHSERVDPGLEALLEPSGVTQYRRTTRPVASGAGQANT
jgi:chemotaxis protein methyltransferase CheR